MTCLILRHALAISIHHAKVELRCCISLVRGLAKPDRGLRVVLGHTVAVVIEHSEVELRGGVALVG